MWGKFGLVLMKFAVKKQFVKSAAASHTGFLTTGNFHQKHCVSNFSEPPRIREFFDEKNGFMVINITTLGQERPEISRLGHAKKTLRFSVPKNLLPLVMFLVGNS